MTLTLVLTLCGCFFAGSLCLIAGYRLGYRFGHTDGRLEGMTGVKCREADLWMVGKED